MNINPEGVYADVTFGGGGHARAILDQLTTGHLYAFDQDEDAAANAFDDDVQRSMQAGLNAHLSKPVEPEQLFATLESLIAS